MDRAPKPPLLRRSSLLRALTDGDRWIFVLALALIAYYCATRGVFQGKASGDGYFGFMYLPGLLYNHTFDLAPTAPYWARIFGVEHSGHVANANPIGPLVFWAPPYLLARLIELVAGMMVKLPSLRPPYNAGGLEPVFDFWMAGLGSLFAGLAGIAATYRLIARRFTVGAARFGAILGAAATPLAWYLVTQPLYQHACAFGMVSILIERWDAWRSEPMTYRRWAILGALGGAATLMRLQEAIWLLLPGLDAAAAVLSALRARRADDLRRALVGGVLMTLAALVVFAPQLALWHYFYGAFRPAQASGQMRWSDPALVATVFSMRAGLLPWSPILYLVVPGLILARKQLGGLAWRFGLLLAIELWVNAAEWNHWGAWSFGARRFTDATPVFACGIAGVYARLASRRWARNAAIAIAALAILYNVLLMELVRAGKIKSSGSPAVPAATWVKWAHGPRWLEKLYDTVGYPFCQPAGWIYAAVYHVPVRTFEGVVGNYVMERDGRIHSVVFNPSISFADPGELLIEGLAGPPVGVAPNQAVPVRERVRLLVPLFAREPVRAKLTGDFSGRESLVRMQWNGAPAAATVGRDQITFDVPVEQVHSRARTNVVELALPAGVRLRKLDLSSTTVWY